MSAETAAAVATPVVTETSTPADAAAPAVVAAVETPAVVVAAAAGDAAPAAAMDTDADAAPAKPDDPVVVAKIVKQVEFYFSDSNLAQDDFMRRLTEADGTAPITKLASFKRMRQLSWDVLFIIRALRTSDVLFVDEAGEKVSRKAKYDPEASSDADARTVYAKGFDKKMSLDDLVAFWNEQGDVKSVRMRRSAPGKDQVFKGSVFVEFGSAADAVKVLATPLMPPKGSTGWKTQPVKPLADADEAAKEAYKVVKAAFVYPTADTPVALKMMTKAEYAVEKAAEEAAKPPRKPRKEKGYTGDDKGDAKNKRKRDGDDAEAKEAVEEEEEEMTYEKDLIVAYEGVAADASREDFKEAFEGFGCTVAWVDFSRGQTDGKLRLSEDSATKAAAAVAAFVAAGTQISGAACTVSALAGETEDAYWKEVWRRKKAKKQERASARGGRRGGRGGFKRRRRD
jgi:lupus La protein